MKKNEIALTEMRATLELKFRTTRDPIAAAQVARAIVAIDRQRNMRRVSRKVMKAIDGMIVRRDDEPGEPS